MLNDTFPATTDADGALTLIGYALHLVDDIEQSGFDGTGIRPIDAALILAEAVRTLTEAWPSQTGDTK